MRALGDIKSNWGIYSQKFSLVFVPRYFWLIEPIGGISRRFHSAICAARFVGKVIGTEAWRELELKMFSTTDLTLPV